MAKTQIYTNTQSHWDDDKDWNPAETGRGVDIHKFKIPAGKKYASYAIEKIEGTVGSDYAIESAPKAGATGEQTVRVKWWYNPFGKIRYTIKVYAGTPTPVTVYFGESNWEGKARDAINQGLDYKIVVRGPQAKELYRLLKRPSGQPMFLVDPVSDTVIITLAIVAGLVGIVAFATIAAVIMYGMSHGYNTKAKFKENSDPLKIELDIDSSKG